MWKVGIFSRVAIQTLIVLLQFYCSSKAKLLLLLPGIEFLGQTLDQGDTDKAIPKDVQEAAPG